MEDLAAVTNDLWQVIVKELQGPTSQDAAKNPIFIPFFKERILMLYNV